MIEKIFPPSVMNKATLRGNEYAFPLSAVEEAVMAGKEHGLATVGGEIQFRIPEGICELYWLEVDSEERHPNESWGDYVARSADEVLSRYRLLQSRTDFVSEGIKSFSILRQIHEQGAALEQYLCMVLYFVEETSQSTSR